jgi:hypothetical protein
MSLERLFKGTISIVLSQIYADTDADFPTPDLYSFNHKITQPWNGGKSEALKPGSSTLAVTGRSGCCDLVYVR